MVDTDLKLIFANIQELTLISLNSVICREVEDSDRDRRQTEECRRPLVVVYLCHSVWYVLCHSVWQTTETDFEKLVASVGTWALHNTCSDYGWTLKKHVTFIVARDKNSFCYNKNYSNLKLS